SQCREVEVLPAWSPRSTTSTARSVADDRTRRAPTATGGTLAEWRHTSRTERGTDVQAARALSGQRHLRGAGSAAVAVCLPGSVRVPRDFVPGQWLLRAGSSRLAADGRIRQFPCLAAA